MNIRRAIRWQAGAVCLGLGLAGGCGPAGGDATYVDEDVDYIETSREVHAIGYDNRGMPVYGVDESGQPITQRPKP